MTVIVSDSFNRADSTTTLGTTDSYNGGTAKTWTVAGAGSYGINNNQAYTPAAIGSGHNVAYVDCGVSDVAVTFTFAVIATDIGGNGGAKISLRVTDQDNQVMCQVRTDQLLFYQYSGGSSTTLATYTGTFANGDVIKVVANTTNLTAYRNGTQVLTTTSAFNQTSTKHGMNLQVYPNARLDNFMIEDLNTGGTGTTYTGAGTVQGNANLATTDKTILRASGTSQGSTLAAAIEKVILAALGTSQGYSSLSSGETLIGHSGTIYAGSGTSQGYSGVSGNEKFILSSGGTAQGFSIITGNETVILNVIHIYPEHGVSQGSSMVTAQETVKWIASGISQGYSVIITTEKGNGVQTWMASNPTTIQMVEEVETTVNNRTTPSVTVILFKDVT